MEEGAIYSADGMTIQFEDGTVRRRDGGRWAAPTAVAVASAHPYRISVGVSVPAGTRPLTALCDRPPTFRQDQHVPNGVRREPGYRFFCAMREASLRQQRRSIHDVIAAVDIESFSCHQPRRVVSEKSRCSADIVN